ncbi:hypothetical protein ACNR9Q_11345 [Maribacter sp. X9]|uniref:hypothetical protein n=1 Tax=Maribacter sp. X9 TaxID=3402159 RepID=UPI003AF3EC49
MPITNSINAIPLKKRWNRSLSDSFEKVEERYPGRYQKTDEVITSGLSATAPENRQGQVIRYLKRAQVTH